MAPAETVVPLVLPLTVRSTVGVTLPPPLLETVWVSTVEVLTEKLSISQIHAHDCVRSDCQA